MTEVVPRLSYSDHLAGLVARADAAARRLASAGSERRAAAAARSRREAARLSARLDASPLEDATAAEVDRRDAACLPLVDAGAPTSGAEAGATGWARALKLDEAPTQEIAAREYANLLACHDAERDLAGRVFDEPLEVLRALHGELCRDLVAPDMIARPRRTEQAVHDGAQGRALYHAPAPERVPALIDALAEWVGGEAVGAPPLVAAGVVHERLLEWQVFEAANGRLARAFGRVVLRARRLDPDGLAVPERELAADPLGYFGEVAATIHRRGDLGPWLERWGEALCGALDDAVRAVVPGALTRPPARAASFAAALQPDERVTVSDYADRQGVPRDTARAELRALEMAGVVRLVPGSRGLRYRRLAGLPTGQGGRPPGQA